MNSLFPFKLCRCFAITLLLLPGRPLWPMRRRLSSHLSCLTRSPSVFRFREPAIRSLNQQTFPRRYNHPGRQKEGEGGETSKFGNGGHPRPVSLAVPFVAPDPSDRVKQRRRRTDGRNAMPRYSSLLAWSDSSMDRFFARHPCLPYILTQPELTLAPLPHPA